MVVDKRINAIISLTLAVYIFDSLFINEYIINILLTLCQCIQFINCKWWVGFINQFKRIKLFTLTWTNATYYNWNCIYIFLGHQNYNNCCTNINLGMITLVVYNRTIRVFIFIKYSYKKCNRQCNPHWQSTLSSSITP